VGSPACCLRVAWLLTAWTVAVTAADPSWKIKPPSAWTNDEAHEVLTDSPWSKMVHAIICPLPTEDQLREGGNMGLPRGVGYDGFPDDRPRPHFSLNPLDVFLPDRVVPRARPTIKLQLRWETALPVRAAEVKSHLAGPLASLNSPDGYVLAVYGVPNTNVEGSSKHLAKPLKPQAFLEREGKKSVRPLRVEVLRSEDALVILYVFPSSAEITLKDQWITFSARVGRLAIVQSFQVDAMKFQGTLEM